MFDANFYADLQREEEAIEVAMRNAALSEHLRKVRDGEIKHPVRDRVWPSGQLKNDRWSPRLTPADVYPEGRVW
jgi:hypothetical protein